MKQNVIKFLCAAFPYLMVVGLWRLSMPFWNPGGILALIPIFFCTFVQPRPYFAALSVLICFLIDYQFNTTLYWTAIFCIVYAINGFQTYVDMTRADRNGIAVFAFVFAISILIHTMTHMDFSNAGRALWIIIWATILYIPITELIRGVDK